MQATENVSQLCLCIHKLHKVCRVTYNIGISETNPTKQNEGNQLGEIKSIGPLEVQLTNTISMTRKNSCDI